MKKTWTKIIIPAAAVAILAIAAALVIRFVSDRPNEIQRYENSITYFYADAEGATRFFCNDSLLEDRIGGRVDSFLSCDGTVGIARAGTGLYRIDKDGILKIYPAGVERALLSLDGSKIVFTTPTEVHIYDHASGKLEDIRPDGVVSVPSIALSPDGSTVGYTIKTADGEFYAYAYENGDSRKLSNDAYVLAIADRASFWYYVKPDDVSLYHATFSGERKIGTNVSSLMEFNRGLTEVTFDMNGTTYCSVNGSAAKTLVEGASVFTTAAECESVQGGENCQACVKGVTTLFGGLFYSFRNKSGDGSARTIYDIWYVDNDRKATELVKGAYQFSVSKDLSRIYCLVDDSLYSMNARKPSDRERICTGVYSFSASRDGSRFYCLGYDMGLYFTDGSSDPVRIAQNAVHSVITREGKCLFITDYDKEGKLHIADGSGNVADVADSVAHVEVMPGAVFYYSGFYEDEAGNNVYDVYCSGNGEHFEKMIEKALMDPSGE